MKYTFLVLALAVFCLHVNAQTVTDNDGNVYNTVVIGTQRWMKENLRTTKLNDGTAIPKVKGEIAWYSLSTPGYCWFNNDSAAYDSIYGKLYNFYAVSTGKLCPTGWHVPTEMAWTALAVYLGGTEVAGGKLKEMGLENWITPNTGATDEYSFTARPGSCREANGSFPVIGAVGSNGLWWSSSPAITEARNRNMANWSGKLFSEEMPMRAGLSVRCLYNWSVTGIDPVVADNAIISPNPARESIKIVNSDYADAEITIYCLDGRVVMQRKADSVPIDISGLKCGMYIVKLVSNNNTLITKLIKE